MTAVDDVSVMPLAKSVGVWVSGDCAQTDSKASHAIWCLSNSQPNSRNLKRIMRALEKEEKKKKQSEEWNEVCPKPLIRQRGGEGGWGARSGRWA